MANSLFSYNAQDAASKDAAKKKAINSLRNKINPDAEQVAEVSSPVDVPQTEVDAETGIGPAAVNMKQGAVTAKAPAEAAPIKSDMPEGGSATPEGQSDAKMLSHYRKMLTSPEVDISNIPSIKSRIDTFLAPANNPEYTAYGNQIDKLTGELADIKTRRGEEINKNEWMQVAQQLGNALLQLGAGAYGMKHGLDMSGVKFSQGDWESRLKNRLDNLQDQANELRTSRTGLVAAKRRTETVAESAAKSEYGAEVSTRKESANLARDTNRQAVSLMLQDTRQAQAEKTADKRTSDELIRMNTKESLANQAELIKKAEAEEAGFQQALQIVGDEKLKPADKEKLLDKALGKTTANPEEMSGVEKPWYQFWGPSDAELKTKYIQSRLKQAQEHTKQLREARMPPTSTPTSPAAPAGQDPQIAAYASQNKLDYSAAEKVLVGRGYKPVGK